MSQPAFEMINSILDIWKIAVQAIMFLVLWAAAFRGKKEKGWHCGIAVYPANIGIGFPSVYRLGAVWRFSCNNGLYRDML